MKRISPMPRIPPTRTRPLKNRAAKENLSPVGGMSVARQVQRLNKWREQYNPLVGLAITRARTLLEAGQRGEFADLQWTYKFVEERFPVLFALIERRTSSIVELDWSIKTTPEELWPAGATQAMADDQTAALRQAYDRIDNLTEAIEHLAMATFRGFAHLQKQSLHEPGQIDHLEPLDQWNWVRDGLYGPWYWNPEAQSTGHLSLGDPIDPDEFLIRTVKRPVNPIALFAFIRWSMGQKDWSGFLEIFGIPGGVVIGPPNVPKEREAEYQTAGEQIAEGGSGYLPNGADYKTNDSPRGVNPFREYLRAQVEDVVLAGTGGLLTMLAESGSGTLAGEAHSDTFKQIAKAEAAKISALFQCYLDPETLSTKFEGKPVLAYFDLAAEEETDVGEIVDHVVKLSSAGYQQDPEELSEKTGYTLTSSVPSVPSVPPAAATDDQPAAQPGFAQADVQATALNGAQVQALADLASNVAQGQLPYDTGLAIAVAAFPLVPSATLDKIFSALRKFQPAAPAPTSQPPLRNRLETGVADQLGVPAQWLAPISDLLTEIETTAATATPEQLTKLLEDAIAQLPELLGQMDVDALADVIEAGLGQAVLEGVRQSAIRNRPHP